LCNQGYPSTTNDSQVAIAIGRSVHDLGGETTKQLLNDPHHANDADKDNDNSQEEANSPGDSNSFHNM
jgi:hypothetical protein